MWEGQGDRLRLIPGSRGFESLSRNHRNHAVRGVNPPFDHGERGHRLGSYGADSSRGLQIAPYRDLGASSILGIMSLTKPQREALAFLLQRSGRVPVPANARTLNVLHEKHLITKPKQSHYRGLVIYTSSATKAGMKWFERAYARSQGKAERALARLKTYRVVYDIPGDGRTSVGGWMTVKGSTTKDAKATFRQAYPAYRIVSIRKLARR